MKEWFTIEKIDDITFAISEYKHSEKVHSYLLVGENKALLIDTGLGICNIKKEVDKITSLPIIVATTQVHWYHIGGHKYFNTIAVHELEEYWLEEFPLSLEEVKKEIVKEPCEFPNDFDIEKYNIYSGKPSILLHDNDLIDLGSRKIEVIHTPGHSPGHICFYDIDRKYLFTGDLVYLGKLDAFYPTTDPIKFRDSINKIKELDVKKILPGHNNLDIDVSLLKKIVYAFDEIEKEGKLKQGNGVFKYDGFSIHI